jgi:hypothetical protein
MEKAGDVDVDFGCWSDHRDHPPSHLLLSTEYSVLPTKTLTTHHSLSLHPPDLAVFGGTPQPATTVPISEIYASLSRLLL